jgi:hypothetical protein
MYIESIEKILYSKAEDIVSEPEEDEEKTETDRLS